MQSLTFSRILSTCRRAVALNDHILTVSSFSQISSHEKGGQLEYNLGYFAGLALKMTAVANSNLLNANDPSQYKYPTLETASHIRLVTICPRTEANPTYSSLSISLQQFPISQCPPYQALSYTWGQPDRSDRVHCEDDEYVNVTPNLLAALLHLQRLKPVTLWVDAICINQEDYKERSRQVSLMCQIYQKAKQVIVWLYRPEPTPQGDNEPWVMVQKPGFEDYHLNEDNVWIRTPRAQEDYKVVELPWYALTMFQHPWFLRIWILQEIAYARDIVIKTGGQTVYWEDAQDWVTKYLDRASDDRNTFVKEEVELNIGMMSVMDEWSGQVQANLFGLRFTELFDRSQYCGATEPKDKVFALLSLASDVDRNFEIDYTWSEAKVCSCLTRHLIRHNNILDILGCIGTRSRSSDSDTLPSWVPNLFGISQGSPLLPYNQWSVASSQASEDGFAVTPLCNETTLVVKCLWVLNVAQVEHAQVKGDELPTLRTLLDVIEQWYDAVLDHAEYESKDARSRINAFWGTIRRTLGSPAVEEKIDKVYTAGEGWHWHFRKLYDEDIGDSQPEDPYDSDNALDDSYIFEANNPELYSTWARDVMFDQAEMRHLRGRAFGFTNKGQMALLPSDVETGDNICLLYGIQMPFVLRRVTEGREGTYRVVGPCYVHQHFSWDKFESQESWEQLQWITLE